MLTMLNGPVSNTGAAVKLRDAGYPAPFNSELEFNSPAHGTWNIVHTGMLLPESHQIFVCTSNCNRGVVLTAAEMGAMERFSTIAIEEPDILNGNLEKQIIDGTTDIISKLPYTPKAILLFTSCVHDFMGCDIKMVHKILREKFPHINFIDCYMDVIRKKTGYTAEQLIRRSIYSLLQPCTLTDKAVTIIGNNLAFDESSELITLIKSAGYKVKDLPYCKSYDDFLDMANTSLYISNVPVTGVAANIVTKKFGLEHLYIPNAFDYDEIKSHMAILAEKLGVSAPDYTDAITRCEKALSEAKAVIGDMPIAIDFNATPRFISLAKLLVQHGFNVKRLYCDVFTGEEKADLDWLRENAGDIMVYATIHPKMRVLAGDTDETYLAIGQKAAYFTSTEHFVNIVEGGGMFGFDGICRLCELMVDAYNTRKDTHIVQRKGLGCTCVL